MGRDRQVDAPQCGAARLVVEAHGLQADRLGEGQPRGRARPARTLALQGIHDQAHARQVEAQLRDGGEDVLEGRQHPVAGEGEQAEQGQHAGGVDALGKRVQHYGDDAAEGERLDDEARQLSGQEAGGQGVGVGAGRRVEARGEGFGPAVELEFGQRAEGFVHHAVAPLVARHRPAAEAREARPHHEVDRDVEPPEAPPEDQGEARLVGDEEDHHRERRGAAGGDHHGRGQHAGDEPVGFAQNVLGQLRAVGVCEEQPLAVDVSREQAAGEAVAGQMGEQELGEGEAGIH